MPDPYIMAKQLLECVPNFSEGRDSDKITAISDAAKGIEGAIVLGIEPDAYYNRTVLTIAGEPEAVFIAAKRVIAAAAEHIDMREHSGEHPRIGAVDVCPFVPLEGVSMEDCAQLAQRLAKEVSEELDLCTFLYGSSASDASRNLLSDLRRIPTTRFEHSTQGHQSYQFTTT